MTIFSHNSMTYLPVKQWWLKPLYWIAKCLNKDLLLQYDSGARMFDIRILFDDNTPIFGHGVFKYEEDFCKVFCWLKHHAEYVRITLERRNGQRDIIMFRQLCKALENEGIKLVGGYSRNDNWNIVYNCKQDIFDFVHEYASLNKSSKVDDIYPKMFAKKYNKFILEKYKNTDKIVMMDFI